MTDPVDPVALRKLVEALADGWDSEGFDSAQYARQLRAVLAGSAVPPDEEMVPHVFTSRTRYEPGDERDIWCKDCEYHRDHRIHTALAGSAVPSQEDGTMADAAEMLWVVLANVSGGDWTQQSAEWQDAAARWRDTYFAALAGKS